MADTQVTLYDADEELTVEIESFNVPVQQDIVHIDTTAHWNAQTMLIAKRGHVYVYSDYLTIDETDVPAMKIGDGTSYLIDLPFASGNNDLFSEHVNNIVRHITADERTFWNNKVTCFVSQADPTCLVFSKESEG